ncbi:MAG: ATPase, T2SS/T4P/T4SS family [Acidimicrobiales bacterium]|nr:ATPase, T2SS/T4P/T4SS family [Acidimicrobiales bacterium]
MDHRDLLRVVADTGASDLHCKPGSVPVLRIGGDLVRHGDETLSTEYVALFAQSMLDADQQDELIRTGSAVGAHSESGVGRFRFAAFRQRGSVALVIHAVPDEIRTIEALDLPSAAASLAASDRGLVLVASPVGNGATTTLTALVDHANRTRKCHVVTVEDPIETLHRDGSGLVSQLEVGADVRSIGDGVRTASKLDADIVAVSDVVDRDTALAVIDAVARGRVVFAAIGGRSVVGAVNTFLELFTFDERPIMRDALARSVAGVLAQQLLTTTSGDQVAAVESMVGTAKIEHCIVDGDHDGLRSLMADGDYHGMQTMDQALARLVRSGTLETDAALEAADAPEELRIALLR